jgi:hypothetical protein
MNFMKKIFYSILYFLFLNLTINNLYSQCTATSLYGGGSAPVPGGSLVMSTCNFAGEYTEVTLVIAGNSYQAISSVATDFVTVRQGTPNGPVIASGTQPLNFTATVSGTYYIHYHTNSLCGTQMSCRTTTLNGLLSGCNNATSGASIVAPAAGTTVTVNACHTANSYSTVTTVAAGANYTVTSSVATDWITIRQGTPGGTLIASGSSPLTWNSTVAGTYYIHINTNSSCGTSATCRNVTLRRNTPACTNTSPFGIASAPTGGATITISTCNYASEYNEITAVAASTTYNSTSSVPTDYITVRQGTFNGPVIAAGTTPLSWTSTVAGTYFIHYNTNSLCGTDATCRTTTLQNQCSLPLPTAVSATPNSVCPGANVNLNATSAGNTIRWYTQATSGTNFGTSASGANALVNPLTTTTYYAEAYSSGGCVSVSRVAVLVTVSGGPAAPTAVSATPTTVCPNSSSNLRATSTGNTIRWYTQAVGGTNIGTSASGANFAVTPLTTTTYYAEAFTAGGCSSPTRTAVTVNTSTAPAPPTNISASPAILCASQTSNLNATANSSGFTGVYAPASWTVTNPNGDAGTVNSSSAPSSISISSSSNGSGSFSSVFYTVNITTTGIINFDWSYTTLDFSATYDYPQYAINGVIVGLIPGFSGAGSTSQLGNSSINVTAGQTFSLVMTTSDNIGGVGTTIFSNFSGPGNGTNTVAWYTAPSLGTLLGTSASGANFPVAPTTTTTYYAQTNTGSGCSSTRVPVTVTVDFPPSPTSVTATPATICPGQSTNLSAISTGSSTVVNGFSGVYAPANWTITHNPSTDIGTVNSNSAPSSISITSSDGGNVGNHSVFYTVIIQGNGNVTFNWSYVTTDINGSAYDLPQYAINGVIVGNVPGFVAGGPNNQSGTATIAVSAGQTFSLLMTATDDILGSGTTVFSNFTAPGLSGSPINWYTTAVGGTSFGTTASGANLAVTPGATITYYAETQSALGCRSATRVPVTVTVGTLSTAPVLGALATSYCPNTNITLTAGGGTAGTGSNIYWYTGPNGTGTLVGTGTSIVVAPSATTTYYLRRQGTCNNSSDAVGTVTIKNYIYAANGTSSTTYCTDNLGWHHFFVGNDIILSMRGNIAGVTGMTATIRDNGAYYLDPGNTTTCIGEVQFEMERNWNISYTGTLSGTYDVRYYFQPAERTAVVTAANNWITTYASCGYTYKYNAAAQGWFWFKNQGTAYSAPDYDDDPTFFMLTNGGSGTTPNGINYATMTGVPNFSGGTGAIILIPTNLLPVEWLYFNGHNEGLTNKLFWATATEENSDFFEVQRSADGQSFETIGTVQASINSNEAKNYTFDDVNPLTGINYYRIRLINKDGSSEFTDIIALEVGQNNNGYSFYPNPAEDKITYQFLSNSNEEVMIEVIDVLGRTVLNKKISALSGNNIQSLNLSELLPGSYTIRATHVSKGISNSSKFTKK